MEEREELQQWVIGLSPGCSGKWGGGTEEGLGKAAKLNDHEK